MAGVGGPGVDLEIPDPLVWLPASVTTVIGTVPVTRERCLWGGWSSDANGGGLCYLWDAAGPAGQRIAAMKFGVATPFLAPAPWPGVYCPNGLAVSSDSANNIVVVYFAPLDQ